MKALFILLVLALGASLGFLRKPGRAARVTSTGLAILTLLLCGVYWFQAQGKKERGFTSRYQMSKGYVIGKELARELPGGGRVLIWQRGVSNEGLERMARTQLKGLNQGAGRVRFKIISADPDRHSSTDMMTYLAQPALFKQAFFDELNQHTEVVAVVSFIGLPAMTESDLDQHLPAVIAVDSGHDPSIDLWLKHPQLIALVIPKYPKERAPQDADMESVFQARYSLVTPENAEL